MRDVASEYVGRTFSTMSSCRKKHDPHSFNVGDHKTKPPVKVHHIDMVIFDRDYLVNKLRSAKALRLDASPRSSRVHSTDHLTARANSILLDAGSEVEFGAIAAVDADEDWVPEKGGVDFIGTIDGETVITSSTDYTDRGGGYGAARLEHLISLAHQQRWPIAFFVDGGGSRARHPRAGLGHLELSGQIGRFTLFDGMAELSGWVPTVAIVSGPHSQVTPAR